MFEIAPKTVLANLINALRFNFIGKFCFFMFDFAWKMKRPLLILPMAPIIISGVLGVVLRLFGFAPQAR